MGNCINKKYSTEDSLNLLDYDYEVVHNIETNKETIKLLNTNLNNLNTTNNDNFVLITKDIEILKKSIDELYKNNEKLFNCFNSNVNSNVNSNYNFNNYSDALESLSNHQLESKYGGLIPVTEQASSEGPELTIDSTSSNANALL